MLNIEMRYDHFQQNHFEKQPVLLKGAMQDRPLQWHELNTLLHVIEPDQRNLQLFLNGEVAAASYVTEVFEFGRHHQRLDKPNFYGLLHQGATLILNQVENYSLAAKRLCAEIGQFAQQPSTSNAYVSFSGQGSFGKHWDTHDVFAVQLLGKKRWQLYAPTLPLPLSQQTSRVSQHNCPDKPTYDYLLDEGDLLYIPRGWWHMVTPLEVASLHLSIGTYPPTLLDYVHWACTNHLPTVAAARVSFCDQSSLNSTLETVANEIKRALLDRRCQLNFLASARANEHCNAEFQTELFCDQEQAAIEDNSRLTLTSCYPPSLGEIQLRINDVQLKLNRPCAEIVELLSRGGSLSWREVKQRLIHLPAATLHEAVLDLLRYQALTLLRPGI